MPRNKVEAVINAIQSPIGDEKVDEGRINPVNLIAQFGHGRAV